MDELITLNQLKEYDAEKTNKLNVRFNNVYDYVDNELNETHNNFNTVNLSATNAQITDLNVANVVSNSLDVRFNNVYNYVDNELNEAHNNFATDNLSATNAQITDLNVANVVSNSLDVNTVSINGVVGNNGQVLGVVNGKSEWMDIPDPIDADNFYVNNIYINNSAKVNGLDVTSYTIIEENSYNNLSFEGKKKPVFYLTHPNGNLYFQGFGYAPFYVLPPVYSVWVNLDTVKYQPNTGNHVLFLNTSPVDNNFYGSSGIYGVQNSGSWQNSISIGVNTRYNGDTTTNAIATNAEELYVYNASYLYSKSYTTGEFINDSFIINPSLVVNAPSDYDPMKYCVNMYRTFYNQYVFTGTAPIYIGNNVIDMTETFYNCTNFNQPVTISDSVTSMTNTFYNCGNLNSPVTIGNSVTSMTNTFYNCFRFNQPIVIPHSVVNMAYAFNQCRRFNQPVVIPHSVVNMAYAFSNCLGFNSPITIGNNVTDMAYAFDNTAFNQPIVIPDSVTNIAGLLWYRGAYGPFKSSISIGNGVTNMSGMLMGQQYFNTTSAAQIHISRSIQKGDRTNYIYNCLVNGNVGTSIKPSQIYNDL